MKEKPAEAWDTFSFNRVKGFRGFRVQGCGSGFAANIYGAMPESLRMAGFLRIVSLPL
jgi:hypothetical protein